VGRMPRMPFRTLPAVLLVAASLAGCRPSFSDADAEELVRRYDALVSQAYRAGDFRIAAPVAGPDEIRRLAGHIGVRIDQGMVLDAILTKIEFRGVERKGDEVVVSTEESWQYTDRRVGSGEQVGAEARDRYRMRYHLRKVDGRWVVVETEFAEKPESSRPDQAMQIDAKTLHGFTVRPEDTTPPAAGAAGPGAASGSAPSPIGGTR
jgi:hypothetical protein